MDILLRIYFLNLASRNLSSTLAEVYRLIQHVDIMELGLSRYYVAHLTVYYVQRQSNNGTETKVQPNGVSAGFRWKQMAFEDC